MANTIEVKVPDIGDYKNIPVIEVLVKPGDQVAAEDSLLTLESDKATMEVPSPAAGVVKALKVKVGDKVSEGTLVLILEATEGAGKTAPQQEVPPPAAAPAQAVAPAAAARNEPAPAATAVAPAPVSAGATPEPVNETEFGKAHASPAVRRLAREFGVDLARVKGTGPKERILTEDVQAYVKTELSMPRGGAAAGGMGFNLPPLPQVDFAKFGPVETKPLSRIKKLSGAFLHRNWVSIPHITQHDEADITELEAFRKEQGPTAQAKSVKLTLLAFLLKACAYALREYPDFSASLEPGGEALILKQYCHIGVAVDTPEGLVVPVLRDVDRKGILTLAEELGAVSERARTKKLKMDDLQGGCFTISSLGGIGGTAFTPIVNAPEVAILGVSRSSMQPVWKDGLFQARLMLPLSLSYDHRVIDGAQAARFTTFLAGILGDVRLLAL